MGMEQGSNGTGWRGSIDGWLEAAYESLLESGVDSVRILPIAKKLNLSRTSFYWFFRDREELLDGLVGKWRDKNTGGLIKQSEAYAETVVEAMLNLFDCWLEKSLFDSQFEFAVRSWALQSPEVLAAVQEADKARIAAISRMFLRYGFDEITADVRARTIYLVQIGYISMQTHEEVSVRMRRISKYVEIFTGETLEQRELNRFFARHGYVPG
jgi:AcrR family transcriptional regulator